MMSQSQYSLTWEAHVRNVCDGLSNLQQNGEFVDMTLAADGHMVKVHQVVMALASPYFKDLIMSAQCPHPVIFLSKVTHATLSAILEYIYTGEVLVSLEHLNDLIEAAKDLYIKGLKDMKIHPTLTETSNQLSLAQPAEEVLEGEDLCLFQATQEDGGSPDNHEQPQVDNMMQFAVGNTVYESEELTHQTVKQDMEARQDILSEQGQELLSEPITQVTLDEVGNDDEQDEEKPDCEAILSFGTGNTKLSPGCSALQYTVSNRGSLQMILNRFVYYLKHTNRDRSRQWRCVNYLSHATKCPALVFTKDDIVVQRISAHTHPFHDKKIFKKLKSGAVFSAYMDAKKEGEVKKKKTVTLTDET